MTTIDRDALIEQAAAEIHAELVHRFASEHACSHGEYAGGPTAGQPYGGCEMLAKAALPVIAKALLAPLRELHYAADNDSARTPRCESCQGRAGVHDCGCWADEDRRPVCGVCNEGTKFQSVPWPCPTVRLLDAIEVEVQP